MILQGLWPRTPTCVNQQKSPLGQMKADSLMTPENLHAAQKGDLKVTLPWLKVEKEQIDSNAHPSTGSTEHYALNNTS